MKQLNSFFKFIGTITLMISIILYLVDSTDWAIVMFVVSISCFAVAVLLKLYLFYHLYFMEKDKQDFA